MLSKIEKQVLASIQRDLPISKRPYYELSLTLGISEKKFVNILKDLTQRGIIRRFGATLRHQKAGYKVNAMTAWSVEENKVEKTGKIIASFKEISHCYLRKSVKEWPYNLYAMVHAKSKEECYRIVEKISIKTEVKIYSLLFSLKELKKTSMIYFED